MLSLVALFDYAAFKLDVGIGRAFFIVGSAWVSFSSAMSAFNVFFCYLTFLLDASLS